MSWKEIASSFFFKYSSQLGFMFFFAPLNFVILKIWQFFPIQKKRKISWIYSTTKKKSHFLVFLNTQFDKIKNTASWVLRKDWLPYFFFFAVSVVKLLDTKCQALQKPKNPKPPQKFASCCNRECTCIVKLRSESHAMDMGWVFVTNIFFSKYQFCAQKRMAYRNPFSSPCVFFIESNTQISINI